ncbi:MFS transporter [Maritimibacter dapengensis]|uniref:MFS transporter n=1 Tax=Maritimibacter dapengensis TaxID=2836868 RepID=A0ABS6T672_9RHOB|nr:MFS transporter [Maritimibacter dapengensis]MBV7380766.1 MFS transporter [Maritimibacter dapengensis]
MTTIPDPQEASERALAYPEFRRFYVGAVCGTNGGWISRILMSWLAWDLTHSPTFVGVIAATSMLPIAIFGPFFGALIDRMSARIAFQRVTLALLAVPVVIAALLAAGWLTAVPLFFVALSFGIVMSAYHPVRQSLGPRLVERPAIGSVVALAALNFNIGRLLAPALGGAMIAAFGTFPTSLIGVVLALPNALIAPTLRPREGDHESHGALLADLAEGFRVVWERWAIRRSILLAVAALGLIRGISEILALVADGMFGRGATGLGLLTSAVGGGALVAAIFQVVAGNRLLRYRPLRFAVIWAGFVGTLGLVHAPSFEWTLPAASLVGFASTFVGVSLQIGVQSRLEDELRGRVMSIWMLANTASTSALAFGLSGLTVWIGLPAATTASVIVASVAVIALWVIPTDR